MKRFSSIITLLLSISILTSMSIQVSGATSAPSSAKSSVVKAINESAVWDYVSGFKLNSQMHNYYIGFHDADFGLSVGYAGKINSTTDSTKTWVRGRNNSMCLYGLDIIDYDLAWTCGNGGNIRMTKDGGKNWKPVSNFGDFEPNQCRFISFLDEKTGWVASPKKLALTTNGGKSWNEIKFPAGLKEIAALRLATPLDGYLLDSHGLLFITTNGGKSWVKRDLGLKKINILNSTIPSQNSPSAAIYFASNRVTSGMVVFQAVTNKKESVVCDFRTVDGGKTWTSFIIPIKFKSPSIYLSNNGSILTLAERNSNDLKQRDAVNIYYNQVPILAD